jgi:hypothetical protein
MNQGKKRKKKFGNSGGSYAGYGCGIPSESSSDSEGKNNL